MTGEAIRRRIDQRVAGGATFEEVDRTLVQRAAWVDDEERSALWLYAWLVSSRSGARAVPSVPPS